MTATRHPYEAGHVRLGGRIERATPGARQTTPKGLEYDQKFIASTELLASDGGVIYVDAWHWDRYMQRPRWIANHDISAWSGKLTEISLGRAVYVAVESGLDPSRVGESGRALCVYVTYAETSFAQEVRSLYDQGGLDDVSVRWDWRTEITRNPFEEEVQKFGEDLHWVCERADLVELSAVLLGADSGAQVVRGDVVAAFERCCARGLQLPDIERLVRGRPTVARPGRALPDVNAAAEPLDKANLAVTGLQNGIDAAQAFREQLMESVTLLQNLANAAVAGEAVEEDEQPSDVQVAFGAVSEALGDYDMAARDVGPAVTAIGAALAQLAAALGLPELVTQDGRTVSLAAVLADRPDAVTRLLGAFNRLP